MEPNSSEGLQNCANIDLDLNADIAGLGVNACNCILASIKGSAHSKFDKVIIAFICSATITVLAVVFGYLSGSLCHEYMTPLDHAVLAWTNANLGPPFRWITRIWQQPFTWMDRMLQQVTKQARAGISPLWPTPQQNEEESGTNSISLPATDAGTHFLARQQALTQFILMSSDQQLVSPDVLSSNVHDFNIVFSLAWFSSTTHLATLGALRTHFRTHTTLRNLRVFVVLVTLGMLFYVKISAHPPGPGNPECLLTDGEGNSYKARYADFFYPQDWSDPRQFPFLKIPLIVVALGYLGRIWRLYVDHDISTCFPRRAGTESLTQYTVLSVEKYHQVASAMDRASGLRQVEPIMRLLNGTKSWETSKSRVRGIFKGLWSVLIFIFLQDGMFFRCLVAIGFSFAYGIIDVVAWRWMPQTELRPDDPVPDHSTTNRMEFGQLLALVLLGLPFLSGIKVWTDYRRRREDSLRRSQEENQSESQKANSNRDEPLPGITKNSELATVMEEFKRHQKNMLKYLAGDVYKILDLEKRQPHPGMQYNSEEAATGELKRDTLMRYQCLKACETEIKSTGTRAVITFSLGIGIILGMTSGVMFPLDYINLSSVAIIIMVLIAVHCSLPVVKWYRLRKHFVIGTKDQEIAEALGRLEEGKLGSERSSEPT
ncbi:hypothetical protein QBC38DRAFT_462066 [Podospora fimiseda]|uniref:Uncharacterized protein n=1 Tax=Podospora fimiseda TaxID=252190 RepID=A0AAN7BEZ1_9PEZI|nr:hypothetical protein QBC38DRAFT_462066 [Podospora fimiseda]